MAAQKLVAGRVAEIPLSALQPDPEQPRKSFDDKSLAQLADSISKRGVLVPLQVRTGQKGKYFIHDGERRYRAAKLAKITKVPVLLVRAESEEDLRTGQLAVNNLRERLKPMEIARLLADLQSKHFATINDLAAHLDRNGLPAMKPKEIQQTIQLCELPEKVQAMINAGTVDTAAAAELASIQKYPAVLKVAVKDMEQTVNWRGRLIAADVKSAIKDGLRSEGIDLSATNEWSINPVHFDPKKACKGCEHLVIGGGVMFCMNEAEFERKNAEAKAAGLLPGGQKPISRPPSTKTKEADTEQKAESRTLTLQVKCRDYLHDYLAQRIITHMRGEIDITDELITWHAMQRPGASRTRNPAIGLYQSRTQAKIGGLEDLLRTKELAAPKLHAAIEIAHSLPWRETQLICHELWGSNIAAVWQMDEAFVNLFRKAELLHLVELHNLNQADGKVWGKLTIGDLKADILARASQVTRPEILQEIYTEIDEPFVPWTERRAAEEEE
jgi:ParB/RepB/Spo0J family partition protein